MIKRPLSVTVIGWIYILAGAVGFAYHLTGFDTRHPFQDGFIWIEMIRVIALVAGVYMLRGQNWARWVALAWIALHVIVSAFHAASEFAAHAVLCAILAYLLFRPAAARYFRTAGT